MSNRIRISIDISHLPDDARRLAPDHIGSTAGQPNALLPAARLRGLRCAVTVDLNVHEFLVGDHAEYGTSVFAAGRAALEFARAELARMGLRKDKLDQLSTAHVAIQKATVAYLFKFSRQAEASAFSMAMTQRARAVGLNIQHDDARHAIEYRGTYADPQSVGATSGQFPHDVVLAKTSFPRQGLVRLDLELGSDFLSGRGWNVLDCWRNAYAEGRYLAIFNENVRGLFRLDTPYRIPTPSETLIERLSTGARLMLRDYLEGRDPNACGRFPPGGKGKSANKRELKIVSEEILAVLGIDIMIPWKEFRDRPHALLALKLGYPGDFQGAHRPFCKANWPKLLAAMREIYEAAVATTAQRQRTNAVGGKRG